MQRSITLNVNGVARTTQVEPRALLAYVLRDQLDLTGTHIGCDTSQCGACTVHIDGRAVKSCTVLAMQAEGRQITTIEGLSRDGGLHRCRNENRRSKQLEKEQPARTEPLPRHVGLPVADLIRPQVQGGNDARRPPDLQEIESDDHRKCDRQHGGGRSEKAHPSRPTRRSVFWTIVSIGSAVESRAKRRPRRCAACSMSWVRCVSARV